MAKDRRLKRPDNRAPGLRKAPFVILFISLGLLGLGIAAGEPARVLEQAVQLCLSCIGIG